MKMNTSRKLVSKEWDPKKDPGNTSKFLDHSYLIQNKDGSKYIGGLALFLDSAGFI